MQVVALRKPSKGGAALLVAIVPQLLLSLSVQKYICVGYRASGVYCLAAIGRTAPPPARYTRLMIAG